MVRPVPPFSGDAIPSVIPKATLLDAPEVREAARFKPPIELITDARIGTYGAICFALLDTSTVPVDDQAQLIRYTIMPKAMLRTITEDCWPDMKMFEMAITENILPEDVHETVMSPKETFFKSLRTRRKFSLDGRLHYVGAILKELDQTRFGLGLPQNHRAYMSTHSQANRERINEIAPLIVERTIDNIDGLMHFVGDIENNPKEQVTTELMQDPHYLPIARSETPLQ